MSYQVNLDVFSGPMDLLLYLIARQEVDIQEVQISSIVDQYLDYMEKLKELNVEISSDFLVMASTLILIKSKTLLPTEEIDLEDEIDQQDELIQHLLEYKKVKILSRALQSKADHRSLLYARPGRQDFAVEDDTIDEDELNLWDIIKAFAKIVKDTGLDRKFEVLHTEKPLAAYITIILDKLIAEPDLSFEALFVEEKTRGEAISLFVGLLELVKRKIVKVRVGQEVNELHVTLTFDVEELKAIKEHDIYRIELFVPEEVPEPPVVFDVPVEPAPVEKQAPQEEESAEGAV